MDLETGRVDKSKMGPKQLLDVAKKPFAPFQISTANGHFNRWTLYISKCKRGHGQDAGLIGNGVGQRVATSGCSSPETLTVRIRRRLDKD